MFKRLWKVSVILTALASITFSMDDDEKVYRLFGNGSFQFGQVHRGQYQGRILINYWEQMGSVNIGVDLKREDGWRILLSPEVWVTTTLNQGDKTNYDYQLPRYNLNIKWAFASWSYGNSGVEEEYTPDNVNDYVDHSTLRIGAGFFPFKYNRDARDLGEYLTRMDIYPQYIKTAFDAPYKQLVGLHISTDLLSSMLHGDALLTSEYDGWPLKDWHLAFLLNFKPKFVEAGVGVWFDHLFSVDKSQTTNETSTNRAVPPFSVDSLRNMEDTTSFYTFRGTKMMFKLAFDFKAFLDTDIFGKNDLRLYSEIGVAGYKDYEGPDVYDPSSGKDYKAFYANRFERMPLLLGFNIPTFKVFEVLSVEFEYWNNPFANSNASPRGSNINEAKLSRSENASKWSWAVFASAPIAKDIKIKGIIGRDHFFVSRHSAAYAISDLEQTMVNKNEFYWQLKFDFNL
jgi:hypothetical protein